MNEVSFENETPETAAPTVWQENHGNLLLIFAVAILVIGACILAYRQIRFVPPRFPDSSAIDSLAEIPPADIEVAADSVLIRVRGAANDLGTIKLAIYESERNFNSPDEASLSQTVTIQAGEANWSHAVTALPKKFAVAAYHDENDDSTLNRNQFGIPTERYGYSRNARGLTGPPDFSQSVIDRPKAGGKIDIFVR